MNFGLSIQQETSRFNEEILLLTRVHGSGIFIHIDVEDVAEADEKIQFWRNRSAASIHLHIYKDIGEVGLMTLIRCMPDCVSLQIENLKSFASYYYLLKEAGVSVGVALMVKTVFHLSESPFENIHHIMIMSTQPGMSGGLMDQNTFKAIRRLRRNFSQLPLWVDGGVNSSNAGILRLLGVNMAVSGSFLARGGTPLLNLLQLMNKKSGYEYPLKDFMWTIEELPVLCLTPHTQIMEIFEMSEQYQMGFVLLVNADRKLLGLCTGADLRKGILACGGNLHQGLLEQFFNPNPVSLNPDDTLARIWQINEKAAFPLLYFPVVDSENFLCGAVTLNQIIRTDS